MLTKSLLRQLATVTSYERGESYFHHESVRRITRMGNTFAGKVDGSERYEVSLSLDGPAPDFDCSCPYSFEGICKHSVAFGLAVLEQFGPTITLVERPPTAPEQPGIDPEQLWQQTTTDQKLTFLRQLLAKQADLRMQLAQFAGLSQPADEPAPFPAVVFVTDTVETISTTVSELLSDLQFDEDGLDMDQDDYYAEESPDPGPLIEEVLEVYIGRVAKALREGRLTNAMTVLLGVYEGIQAATEPEADEYGIIEDYPEQAWEIWTERLTADFRQLANRVLHPDQITLALNQLAERVRYFDEADDNPDELYYDLRPFEPLLLAMVTDEPSARAVQAAIDRHDWQKRGTEYVQLRAADVLHDPGAWLLIADRFADHDATIAEWLLLRRQAAGDRPALLRELHRFTPQFAKTVDAFVLKYVDEAALAPGPDLNLYLTALQNRCLQLGQLPDYLKLRKYWTDGQRRAFAASLVAGYRTGGLFYAQVLHTEGHDADLLAWLKTLSWPGTSSLPDILTIAARTYPDDCLRLTVSHVNTQMETAKRDRGLYGMVAGWLAALSGIPSLKPKVAVVVSQLLANYPRLSALRDELRMKGLAR